MRGRFSRTTKSRSSTWSSATPTRPTTRIPASPSASASRCALRYEPERRAAKSDISRDLMTLDSADSALVRLRELERDVARDLAYLAYPDKSWVEPVRTPDGSAALDCAVIGGGQFGLAIAFGLRRERVDNVAVFDASRAGFEGPW